MNTAKQHRLRVRRGRVRSRFTYRNLVRVGLGASALLGLYLVLKIFFPALAGLLDGLFAGLIERVTRGEEEE